MPFLPIFLIAHLDWRAKLGRSWMHFIHWVWHLSVVTTSAWRTSGRGFRAEIPIAVFPSLHIGGTHERRHPYYRWHLQGVPMTAPRWSHPSVADPGACRVESLAQHYVSKQWLKLLLCSWHRMKMSLSAPWERLFGLDLPGKAGASVRGVAPARLPHGAAMFMATTGRAGRTESFVVAPCPPHIVPSPRALQCIAAGQVQQQLYEFWGKKMHRKGRGPWLILGRFGGLLFIALLCLGLWFSSEAS